MIGTASTDIAAPRPNRTLSKKRYTTNDIVQLVQRVVKDHAGDTARFAKRFSADEQGLRRLFDFVDQNFRYVEDPAGSQWVQTPAWLNEHKEGDCKSFTVFISSVLQNMGIDHIIRYVAYGTRQLRHVYPVAIMEGKEMPLDVVWKKQDGGRFGAEKPYTRKKDFKVRGLYKLGNVAHTNIDEAAIIGQLENTLESVEQVSASIPDLVNEGMGDVTQMSKGEAERLIWADRFSIYAEKEPNASKAHQYRAAAKAMEQGDIGSISGIGSTSFRGQVVEILAKTAQMNQKAFEPFTVQIPNPVPPHLRGFFKGIGKFFKKVGKAIGNVFKKFVNWMFKGAAQSMGPFFLFRFLKRNLIKSPKIRKRMEQQDKTYTMIRRLGKFDSKQFDGLLKNGVVKHMNYSPEDIFGRVGLEEGGKKVSAAPAAAPFLGKLVGFVVKAIGFVIKVVKKVVGIFKKKRKDEAGQIDENTMSDPRLLEEEVKERERGAGGGGSSLLPLAAAGVAVLLRA
ncbi:MAG: hypothetical protein AAF741_15615 [Bacteroidota bacterium]